MARWRMVTLVLLVLALALWTVILGLNLRPELSREVQVALPPAGNGLRLQEPLSGLPGWVGSAELFVTLFLAGLAGFFLFPRRLRNMVQTLQLGWGRVLSSTLLGLGFGLLLLVFGFGAALARITFPFTILTALVLVLFAAWGFLAAAYTAGHLLLKKAGWGRFSPVVALALGLLLLVPLIRIPFAGGIVIIFYMGLGLGLVISTRFGSNEPWSLMPLLEEENE